MICETCRYYSNKKCMKHSNRPGWPDVTMAEAVIDNKCQEYESRPYTQMKPPAGCSPYYVDIDVRLCKLCEAIKEYSTQSGSCDQIRMWALEILCLIEMKRTLDYESRRKVFHESEMTDG